MPPGILLANMHGHSSRCLLALDHNGHDITDNCFSFTDGAVRTRRELIPSMLTPDIQVIRQDCLCYLMERINPNTDPANKVNNDALPDIQE